MSIAQELLANHRRKMRSGATAFMVVCGLAALIVAAVTALSPDREHPVALYGLALAYAGLGASIGTAMLKGMRWAAITATVLCSLAILAGLFNVFVIGGEHSGNTSFGAGRVLGGLFVCALMALVLFAVARAAFAGAPPSEDDPLVGADPDLAQEFLTSQPYGIRTGQPPSMSGQVRAVVAAGFLMVLIGGVTFGLGLTLGGPSKTIDESQWQAYKSQQYGFSAAFPGEPTIQDGIVKSPNLSQSRLHSILSKYHRFEVLAYELRQGLTVTPQTLEADLDNATAVHWAQPATSSVARVPGAEHAMRRDVALKNGGRGVFLAATRQGVVYLVLASETQTSGTSASDSFVARFSLITN